MNRFLTILKEHYADFNGRARRKDYWVFTLWSAIISFVLCFLVGFPLRFSGVDDAISLSIVYGIVYLFGLAILLPSIALGVRRLHDIGKSGLWYLSCLVPVAGSILLLIFFCRDSQPGPNKWGANPKGM